MVPTTKNNNPFGSPLVQTSSKTLKHLEIICKFDTAMFKASQQVNDLKEEILETESMQVSNNVEVNNSLSLSLPIQVGQKLGTSLTSSSSPT